MPHSGRSILVLLHRKEMPLTSIRTSPQLPCTVAVRLSLHLSYPRAQQSVGDF